MGIDWNRRTCARRGHLTYLPHEEHHRAALRAATAAGDAWRCLRCGDFTLGPPHRSGPAAEAPLVPRGKVLRDLFILRFLAVERAVRGVFIVLAAVAVWQFSNSQDAVRRFFDQNLDAVRPVAVHFHYDLDHSPVVDTIRKTFGYHHSTLVLVASLLLVYALVEIVEGVGLWRAKRWAEYLTVVATAAFLPLEIYELTEKVSWLKIATLVINILAVLYIAFAKRLFGLRGGRAAFDAERRSASLLEAGAPDGAPAPAHHG
ncbi:hypothetical protein ADL22_18085 [Streptomyces sp. NRRL F-4489]|uniref:DUF2127 domain-containing protein n=1 Tax=Streptomyces sp. NRRL F-4489 TaxID=1609095 RepID=UPI00074AC95D|nr:DUF2127 domain-containing protein [Streptomyces sp. NRRL F-4489]KUL38550.1 hypothetical protein ADL22_18085 [Streptomyces sp. NRRL F-4489]